MKHRSAFFSFLALILFTLTLVLTGCKLKDSRSKVLAEVIKSSDKAYIVANWADFGDEEKVETMKKAYAIIKDGLKKSFGENRIVTFDKMDEMLNKPAEDPKSIEKIIELANKAVLENAEVSEKLGLQVSANALWPNGFILFFGLGASGDLGIGVGASANLAFIVIPTKVVPVDYDDTNQQDVKTKFEKAKTYIRVAMAVFPSGSAGIGVGGGLGGDVGFGLLWGRLLDPKDLQGIMGGVSVSGNLGVGFHVKFAMLRRSTNKLGAPISLEDLDRPDITEIIKRLNQTQQATIYNPMFLLSFGGGAEAGVQAHASISYLFPLNIRWFDAKFDFLQNMPIIAAPTQPTQPTQPTEPTQPTPSTEPTQPTQPAQVSSINDSQSSDDATMFALSQKTYSTDSSGSSEEEISSQNLSTKPVTDGEKEVPTSVVIEL